MTSFWDQYEDSITRGLGLAFDAVLLTSYVTLTAMPAMAVVTGEVSWKLALAIGLFAGVPQGLRHVLRYRGLANGTPPEDEL